VRGTCVWVCVWVSASAQSIAVEGQCMKICVYCVALLNPEEQTVTNPKHKQYTSCKMT